jgi:hypothetical protein
MFRSLFSIALALFACLALFVAPCPAAATSRGLLSKSNNHPYPTHPYPTHPYPKPTHCPYTTHWRCRRHWNGR